MSGDQQQQQHRHSPAGGYGGGGGWHQTQVQYPAAGMSTAPRRRRLSNALSDGITPAEGRSHAGPPPARRAAAAAATYADHDATSEDEIESLKRDMGSDLWALQRQRMRREQLNNNNNNRQRPSGSATESPGSPLAQDASPVARGKAMAHSHYQQPAGLALHRLEASPPPPPPPLYGADAYAGTGSPTQPYAAAAYAHQPHYAHRQLLQQHHAQTALAYSAAPAYVHGRQLTTAPPLPPIVDATSVSRDYSVAPGYALDAPHYVPKLWQATSGGYPTVVAANADGGGYLTAAANADGGGRYESASVQSYDQASASHTDASGYSQHRPQHATNPFATASHAFPGGSSAAADHHARLLPEQAGGYQAPHNMRYPPQQQQQSPPPPMAHAHSPLHHHAAGSPPMEQKRLHAHAAPAETAQPAAVYSSSGASAARTTGDHVTDMGSTAAYHAPSYASRAHLHLHLHHQALPPAAAARVSPPMQEMQEQHSTLASTPLAATFGRLSPPALHSALPPLASSPPPKRALSDPVAAASDVAGAKAPSAIAIQSLLNSPLEDTFVGAAEDADSRSSAGNGSDSAAIHQHIAKENARFHQNSSTSGQMTIPSHIAPSVPTAHHHNSSPNSRSSYHSAGYSVWHGRAETVNLDFATAQQSLSSTDDAVGLGLSMANDSQRLHASSAYLPNAPLPSIPASFTFAANAAAAAADAIASMPPPPPPVRSDGYQYRYYKPNNKRDSKPISVLVQVSDGSREGSVDGDGALAASPPGNRAQLPSEIAQLGSDSPNTIEDDEVLAGDAIVKLPLGRKGTNESLDNVLEYYRTHSSDALDNKSTSSTELVLPTSDETNTASKADLNAVAAARVDSLFDAGFQSPQSLAGTHVAAPVAVESASSVQNRQRYDDAWPETHYPSLGRSGQPSADSSLLGTHPHTREQTPVADYSVRPSSHSSSPPPPPSPPSRAAAVEIHDNEQLLSARHWHIDVGDSYIADMDMYGPHAAPNPWQQRQAPPQLIYHHGNSVYDSLEQLAEPEALELPPTTTATEMGRIERSADADGDDCVVQMEMIDGISELSDMLDMSTTHDSDYGYSSSNSSTDSFGEPIEHETGILAKSLGPRMQNIAALTDMSESVSRLANDFSRTALLAPSMVIHQLSTTPSFASPRSEAQQYGPQPLAVHSYLSRVASPPLGAATSDHRLSVALNSSQLDGAGRRLSELAGETSMPESYSSLAREIDGASAEALHSGRTNASTLTTSTNPDEHAVSTAAVVADIGSRAHIANGGAAAAAAAVASAAMAALGTTSAALTATLATSDTTAQAVAATTTSTSTTAVAASVAVAANTMPLEIMELAGELEISLAREQEDYYNDNVSQANLDPMILQNLGKAVHQQCLLQRQHLQRRKSNMHLGLAGGGGGNSSSDEHGGALLAADMQYDDYEQALKAMLIEVSLYFAQSGLNQVFPFSAKWVDWLTRHPDRPFPWRKDSEDDDEANRGSNSINGGGRGEGDGGGGDADDDSDARSEASSFGEEPPAPSRPLPPEDVLSKATIPMSMRRPVLVKDFVSQEKRRGINAHWQYYSVINQITVVASGIHRRLVMAEADADHSFVAHQLAALYQFLGGDFKKFKPGIESIFETIKQSLRLRSTATGAVDSRETGRNAAETESALTEAEMCQAAGQQQPKVLDAKCVSVLREMMASIIAEALYSTSKVAAAGIKEQPPPNTPTAGIRAAKQAAAAVAAQQQTQTQTLTQQQQQQQTAIDGPLVREATFAISTLKGLPTQPIIRYLTKEMRAVNGERRRRGLAHNLSRNNSMGHLRHHQFSYQNQQPPLPPLPPMPVVAAAAAAAAPVVPATAAMLHNAACHSGSSASSTSHAPIAAAAAAAASAAPVNDGLTFEHNRTRRNNNSHQQTPMPKQQQHHHYQHQQYQDNVAAAAAAIALLQPILSAADDEESNSMAAQQTAADF